MGSDIMILLKEPVDEIGAEGVRNTIYDATSTAVVSFNEARPKLFLVRFDPNKDTPKAILTSVRDSGVEASIIGG